jgi:predicted RNA-binding protein with PUA-like domain
MNYWLLKSEPETYSWDDLVSKGKDHWDGVRNYQARNHLQTMQEGDWAFFYHSGESREIVGICQISRTAYPDPTTDDPRWLAVEVVPLKALKKPVPLKAIKAQAELSQIALVKQSRLSVMPVKAHEFDLIVGLSESQD